MLHGEGAGSLAGGPDDGDDVIFGDHGVVTQFVPAGRPNLVGPPLFVRLQTTRLVLVVETAEPQNGNADVITGDTGEDRIGGGNGDDLIEGNDGLDTIFGDHGRIEHDTPDGIIRLVTTTDPLVPAGDDVISGDAERDVILGGNGRDVITGDAERDVILGDHGLLIDRTNPSNATANGTWDVITTTDPNQGDADVIEGNDANDIIFGGTAGDVVSGNDGNDLVFGDHGKVESTVPFAAACSGSSPSCCR